MVIWFALGFYGIFFPLEMIALWSTSMPHECNPYSALKRQQRHIIYNWMEEQEMNQIQFRENNVVDDLCYEYRPPTSPCLATLLLDNDPLQTISSSQRWPWGNQKEERDYIATCFDHIFLFNVLHSLQNIGRYKGEEKVKC